MLLSPRHSSVAGPHCSQQAPYSWLDIGHSLACSKGSSSRPAMRRRQHRAAPHRQCACCSAAVHESRYDRSATIVKTCMCDAMQ